MSAKQDRAAARTVTDLERKYKFGETFAEVMGYATDARQSAEEAEVAAKEAKTAVNNLDQDEIFNRLTNNGEAMGIYREDGQIYINASYIMAGILNADFIKTGVITSADGTVKIDIMKNEVTVDTSDGPGFNGKIVLSAKGIEGFGYNSVTEQLERTLVIQPGVYNNTEGSHSPSVIRTYNGVGIAVYPDFGQPCFIGDANGKTSIFGSTVELMGKEVWWEWNGDGSYTLKGR